MRVLSSFVGLGQYLQLAIAPARLYLRALHDVIKTRATWNSDVRLSKQALRDLQWWADIHDKHLQRAIYREATTATLFTDASMRGWGGVCRDHQQTVVHGIWDKTEGSHHITYLELLGVVRSVVALLPRLARKRVLLFVDNMAVVYVIRNNTSRAPLLMAELRHLMAICDTNNTRLECVYVPTDRNVADGPSRLPARDMWRLDPSVFRSVTQRLGLTPTIDRFATATTTLLPRWNAPCPEPGSVAPDGLSQDWTAECSWIHPPLNLLPDVAAKLDRAPSSRAIVVAPFWPAEQWFDTLHRLASSVLVVPHTRRLVCQDTLRKYGVDAPGDWPCVFFLLEGQDLATTGSNSKPRVTWCSWDEVMACLPPM